MKPHYLQGKCYMVALDTGKSAVEYICINKVNGRAASPLGFFIDKLKNPGKGPWDFR